MEGSDKQDNKREMHPFNATSLRKQRALELRGQGLSNAEIAERCGITLRSIQRYFRDLDITPVPAPTPEPVLTPTTPELVPTPTPALSEATIETTISRQIAIRLLALTDGAIATVEGCLNNPEARMGDKLKAAALIAKWTGVESGSILDTIAWKAGAILKITPDGAIEIISKKQAEAEEKTKLETEARLRQEAKQAREALIIATHDAAAFFLETEMIPETLFDEKLFLEIINTEEFCIRIEENLEEEIEDFTGPLYLKAIRLLENRDNHDKHKILSQKPQPKGMRLE